MKLKYEIEALGLDTDKITVLDNKDTLYDFIDTLNKIEKEYLELNNKDESFEKALDEVKKIVDIVEVDKEEIQKANNYLIKSFDNLKNPSV